MKLQVVRFSSSVESTSGALYVLEEEGRKFLCYTLEDEHRDIKLRGETRIPAGTYKIEYRTEGGFHAKYSKRFQDIHKGMLHIIDVPNFDYILIHCGNTDKHTAGCLLVGDTQHNNMVHEKGFVGQSTLAYKRIYPIIAKALDKDEEVYITYTDFD